ncbi:MAG: hypothetical protein ACRETP_03510 [Steroidobacteraceae bacterium]
MHMARVPVIAIGLIAAAISSAQDRETPASTTATPYAVLDDQGSQLRSDFNRHVGSVRLLFVVDPICPTCLRGLNDMDRDLLRGTPDPRMWTFVVHEPVLGTTHAAPWSPKAEAKDVVNAAQLLHNAHVEHYWNASGAFGQLLSQGVGLKNGDGPVYAWDVWLIYGPDAVWQGPAPTVPALLMHQLGALRGSAQFPRLDSHVFAERAHGLLAQLPASTSTPSTKSPP